jgi:5'-3' exoribonuclease 2
MQEMQEAERELRAKMRAEGLEVPPEPEKGHFDSNVITPGTPFMYELSRHLQHFIMRKVQEDPGWRKIKIVFSDASVPGEGEHKIMDYIRAQRGTAGYDPNTSHVIHGLDADLIMLGLATHEPHFWILREEVTVGDQKPQSSKEQAAATIAKLLVSGEKGDGGGGGGGGVPVLDGRFAKPFQFVQLSVLREYLEVEFRPVDYTVAGGFDLERVVDDFVLMCFFVGNDFLPHLPSLDIHEGALDTIFYLYKTFFPELGGYLSENLNINMRGLKFMMREIGLLEDEVLRSRRSKEAMFQRRRSDKKVKIQNKSNSQEHLRMIRRLTTNLSSNQFGGGSATATAPAAEGGEADGGPPAKRSRVTAFESDAPAHLTHTSVEAFRIKNRTVGGGRALQPGATAREAQRLGVMDKIREFADKTGPKQQTTVVLKDLSNQERAMAHGYCEELGLSHDSKGQEPNRYIVVARPGDLEDKSAVMSADERADAFESKLKTELRAVGDAFVDTQVDKVDLGREGWRERYYEEKMPGVNPDDVARCYVEGLVWVFGYYYKGVQSWNWFFPYHYAPFASDLDRLLEKQQVTPAFELGKPFTPFEQLMSVFPSASKFVLPTAFQELMDESSPLGDFYPEKFEIDLNGKKQLWKAVILLPFIDEERLLTHVKPLELELAGEERVRNEFGPTLLYCGPENPLAELVAAAPVDTPLPPMPDDAAMNAAAANKMRAELSDDPEVVAKADAELERLRVEAQAYLAAAATAEGLPLDPALLQGLSGTVKRPATGPAVGETVPPLPFHGNNQDHPYRPRPFQNTAVAAVLEFPPTSFAVAGKLLKGTVLPPKQLGGGDGPVAAFSSLPPSSLSRVRFLASHIVFGSDAIWLQPQLATGGSSGWVAGGGVPCRFGVR